MFIKCRFDINYDIGSHMSCSQSQYEYMNMSKSDLHLAAMVEVKTVSSISQTKLLYDFKRFVIQCTSYILLL